MTFDEALAKLKKEIAAAEADGTQYIVMPLDAMKLLLKGAGQHG